MQSKDTSFTLVKQAAYVECELDSMEKTFRFMLEKFGDEAACNMFADKKATYQKWNAIKESLDRLYQLQENLDSLGKGLYERLSTQALPEGEILDAIIDFHSNHSKK